MNHSDNRYQKWLGLIQTRPDFFELLCIAPNVSDVALIKQAAKSALKRIGPEPESPDDRAEWDLVRAEIKQAYRCLSDDNTRAAYLAQLLVQAKKPPGKDDSQVTDRDLETVADELRSQQVEQVVVLEDDLNDDQDIPVAAAVTESIPVANLVPESNFQDSKSQNEAFKLANQSDASSPTQGAFNVKTNRNRVALKRKRSAVPTFIMLAVLIGGGLATYLLIVKPQLDEAAAKAENAATADSDQTENEARNSNDRTEKDLRRERNGNRELPDLGSNTNRETNRTDRDKSSPQVPGDSNALTGNNTALNRETELKNKKLAARNAARKATRPTVDTSWATFEPAAFPHQFGFYHHVEEAGLAMRRREWDQMSKHFDAAKPYVRDQKLLELWTNHHIVADAYRDFWRRAIKNAAELPAMTELDVAEEKYVVTEASRNRLIYRHAGQRMTDQLQRLPTLLALSIVENSLAADSPESLKSRLAVYGIAHGMTGKYHSEFNKTVESAIQMNLWTADFLTYQPKSLESIYQPSESKQVTRHQIRGRRLIRKYYNDIPLMQGLAGLDYEGFRVRAGQLRDLVLQANSTESEMATVVLEFTINEAIKRIDPDLVTELMNLQKRRMKAGGESPNYMAVFESIAQKDMNELAARRLFVHVLDLHKQHVAGADETESNKSLVLAKSIARANKLSDELERLERDYGKNNPRKAGRLGI